MRILVTGGAGVVGSHYVRAVRSGAYPGCRDARLTVLDTRAAARAGADGCDVVRGDVGDRALLARVLPGHDAVVHLAESRVDRSPESTGELVRTNVMGTQALLDACSAAGIPRLVLLSTVEVYGAAGRGPDSPYAASKAAADLLAHAHWRSYGLHLSIIRCAVWVPVERLCRAIHLVLTRGGAGETYDLGAYRAGSASSTGGSKAFIGRSGMSARTATVSDRIVNGPYEPTIAARSSGNGRASSRSPLAE